MRVGLAVLPALTASYVYDAEGRRVHESVGGVVKEYVYGAAGQELTVVDGSQNLIQGETYFDGRLLGTQEPAASSGRAPTSWARCGCAPTAAPLRSRATPAGLTART